MGGWDQVCEHDHANTGLAGDEGRIRGIRVVLDDVAHQLREALPSALGDESRERFDQMGRQYVVDQQVCAAGVADQVRRACGVSAHDCGAAPVLEAIAIGRLHRPVIDPNRGDAQSSLFEDRRGALFADLDAACSTLRTRGRQGLLAVMRDAIAGIECVGLLEAEDHLLHAGRAVDGQCRPPSRQPALHHHLAQLADVIRVEVREQDARQVRARDAPELQLLL
jgi:hypothetical protein